MLCNMNNRAVGTKVILQCHICVSHCKAGPSVIAGNLGRPVENREIHKAVDDGPVLNLATLPGIVPRTDKSAGSILVHNEAGEERCSGVHISVLGHFVAGKAVERTGKDVPHKSYIVVEFLIRDKRGVEQLLRTLCSFEVLLILCAVVEHSVKAAPESGGPALGCNGSMYAILKTVNKLVAGAKGDGTHLLVNLGKGLFRPRLIFFEKFFVILHFCLRFLSERPQKCGGVLSFKSFALPLGRAMPCLFQQNLKAVFQNMPEFLRQRKGSVRLRSRKHWMQGIPRDLQDPQARPIYLRESWSR